MCANAFIGRTTPPNENDLAVALGPAKAIWDELLSGLAPAGSAPGREWKCYATKAGWSLRVMCNDRTIVWLSPGEDCFQLLFIFGEAALAEARRATLPQRVRQAINDAPRYPEGSGVRLRVKSMRDLVAVKKLAMIKLAH